MSAATEGRSSRRAGSGGAGSGGAGPDGAGLRTAPLGDARRPTPVVRAVLAQARMELRLVLRSSESLVVTLGLPLGVLALFSTVEVLPTGGARAVDFLVPGVLAISVGATGIVVVAVQTAFERKYAVLKRLGVSPLSRSGFLVAKALAVVAILVVQSALVVALAAGALGWRPTLGPATALAALGLVALGAIATTSTGLLMAGRLRAEATLAGANALFLVLVAISGVAFDAAVLPEGIARIGAATPVGALAEALRAVLDGESARAALLRLTTWALVATLAAARTFRWEP